MTVHQNFIEPMLKLFESPPGGDPEGFFAALRDELSRFTDAQLEAAAAEFKRTRKYRTFPSVAECIERCRTVPGAPVPPRPLELSFAEKHARRKRACERVRCTSIAEGARDGRWLHGLVDFVEANDRMPDRDEQRRLIATAHGIEENLRAMRDMPLDPLKGNAYPALASMRRKMVNKAEREVFGEASDRHPEAPPLDLKERQQAKAQERLNELAIRTDPLPKLSNTALARFPAAPRSFVEGE